MKQVILNVVNCLWVLLTFVCLALPNPALAGSNLLTGDVVFVIDESGSMRDDIQQVRNNVGLIANQLGQTIDARFGLVGFGATSSHRPEAGSGQAHIHTSITGVSGFQSALNELVASGGVEPGLSATITGMSGAMQLRPGAAVCVVLITDEDADDPQNLSAAIQALQNGMATWFGVVWPSAGNTNSTYGPNAGSLAATTGGSTLSILDFRSDPQPVLDALLDKCVSEVVENNPVRTAGTPGSNPGVPFSYEPVNLVTGNYVLQVTNLAVPGRGLPLVVNRTYNSFDTTETSLGAGWRLNFHMELAITPGGDVVVVTGDGRRDFYVLNADGTFSAPAGIHAELTQETDGSYSLEGKNRGRFLFDENGRLLQLEDRNGNTQVLTYDGQGRLEQITDTVGRVVTMAYNADERLETVTDAIGRTIAYGYNGDGLLSSATNPNGETTSYGYDAAGRLETITNALGDRIVTNEYDNAGRVVRQTDARDSVTTFAYDPANQRTTETDPLGRTTAHHYDDNGLLTRRVNALGNEVRFTYDDQHNRTSATDPNGNVATFTYDDRGNLTSVTNALGAAGSLVYDGDDNLTGVTDALGSTASFAYDGKSNLLNVTDGVGNTTAFAYDPHGQRTKRTDARGNVTQYGYDDEGNVTTITNALGHAATLDYDAIGRLVGLTDPGGGSATADYDAVGRLTEITDALGYRSGFGYDAAGRLIEVRDAKGYATVYDYGLNGNLTEVADALGHATRYAYDAVNNRVGMTDANGNTATYAFDDVNRLVETTDPLGNAKGYTYDPAGNVGTVTDANGATNAFVYDAVNRLVHVARDDGKTVSYEYDANGNRTKMVDARGTTTYGYDSLDRPTRIDHPDGTVKYGYDAIGNRTRLTYPDGRMVKFAYDALNRLHRVTDWDGDATRYVYDSVGNLARIKFPNKTRMVYSYDGANRLVDIARWRRKTLLDRLTYVLDELGNRIAKTRKNPGARLRHDGETYAYDALSQLVGVDELHRRQPRHRTEYVYDPVGNRISQIRSRFKAELGWRVSETAGYQYDAANRLMQGGDMTFTHDANGNRLTETDAHGRSRNYDYDAIDRLIAVTETTAGSNAWMESTYEYDGDGNKVEQRIDESGNLRTVGFLSDVASPLPVTLRQTTPEQTLAFVYGLGRVSLEQTPVNGSPQDFYYHGDGLGSTVELTDSNGRREALYRYDAWGNLKKDTDEVPNRFRYTGEEEDPITGLYYLRARWYDPKSGFFLTQDPLGGVIQEPRTSNKYTYVLGNPVNLIDPLGLYSWSTARTGFRQIATGGVRLAGDLILAKLLIVATGSSYGLASPLTVPLLIVLADDAALAGQEIYTGSSNVFNAAANDQAAAQNPTSLVNLGLRSSLNRVFPNLGTAASGLYQVFSVNAKLLISGPVSWAGGFFLAGGDLMELYNTMTTDPAGLVGTTTSPTSTARLVGSPYSSSGYDPNSIGPGKK